MGRHEIYHPANERQAHRARQRGEHIKPPELAVAQPERRLPFRNRRGNEECLPETRKVREHESAGDPTEVAPYECKQRSLRLVGGESTVAIGAYLSSEFALLLQVKP